MPAPSIDLNLKKKCVEMSKHGYNSRQIYEQVFKPERGGMSYECFRRRLQEWKHKTFPDDRTLRGGTYEGFIAHGATVQVSAEGTIRQAWIKQTADQLQLEEILNAIKENVEPKRIEHVVSDGEGMLEIPLFDLHFPLSDHTDKLRELLGIIESKNWDEINFVIGQDLFHNDDHRGRTSSGRPIERVDMVKLVQSCVGLPRLSQDEAFRDGE